MTRFFDSYHGNVAFSKAGQWQLMIVNLFMVFMNALFHFNSILTKKKKKIMC